MSVYWDGTVSKLIIYSRAYLECAPCIPVVIASVSIKVTVVSFCVCFMAEKNKFTYLDVFSMEQCSLLLLRIKFGGFDSNDYYRGYKNKPSLCLTRFIR